MASYTVIQKVDQPGFQVAIVGSDGVRQTILGFATQADAEAWISRDKWQSAAERYLIPLNQRTDHWRPVQSQEPSDHRLTVVCVGSVHDRKGCTTRHSAALPDHVTERTSVTADIARALSRADTVRSAPRPAGRMSTLGALSGHPRDRILRPGLAEERTRCAG